MFEKLKLGYVPPVVLYLYSEECADSGMCINVFGGYVNRSAVLIGVGVVGIETPAQVMENWNRIVGMENPVSHNSLPEMVTGILHNGLPRKG